MNSIKIAVIDNGIDSALISFDLENKVYVDCASECVTDDKDMSSVGFIHGTFCAYIIKINTINSKIYSIRILDEKGKGLINSISPALEWCYKNGIRLVNLSLGTTHFRDKNKIREIINSYAYKGIIIVAATSNSGYTTYPASFSNVISVEVGDDFCFAEYAQKEKGIDFSAPVKQELFLGKTPIGNRGRTRGQQPFARHLGVFGGLRPEMRSQESGLFLILAKALGYFSGVFPVFRMTMTRCRTSVPGMA